MASLFQPFTSLGSLMGAVVSNIFHLNLTKHSYQIQLAILYAVPVWLAIVVWFLPESVRWLCLHGRDADARKSLVRLRPKSTTPDDIDGELATIQEAIKMERAIASTVVWKDIWRGSDLVCSGLCQVKYSPDRISVQRRTLLSMAAATFHAASGANFIVGCEPFICSPSNGRNLQHH